MQNELTRRAYAGTDVLPPKLEPAAFWYVGILFVVTAMLVGYALGFPAMVERELSLEHRAVHGSEHEHKHGHGECHGHGHGECHQHVHSHGCNSTMHSPGACHGFEAPRDATWKVAHGNFNLADSLNPSGAAAHKRQDDMLRLGGAVAASVVMMVLELSCGYIFGSLALLSDGVHQLSDVALYAGLMLTVWLSGREGNSMAYSFGYDRVQVVGGLIALLLQYFATGLLVTKALDRLASAQAQNIDGRIICLVSLFTLITSFVLIRVLPNHSHGHSHGEVSTQDASAMGVARLHVLADLVQGFICACVGLIIWLRPEYSWADSVSTFTYAAVVVMSSRGILRELINVLLERTPPELDAENMFGDLARIKGIVDVHCCHAWLLAPEKICVSAHMHIEDGRHEEVLHAAQIILRHKYGIIHSTLQVSEDEDLA